MSDGGREQADAGERGSDGDGVAVGAQLGEQQMSGDEQSKTGDSLSAENKMLWHSGASQSNLGDLTNSGKVQSNSGDSIDSGSNTLNITGHNQSRSGDLIWAESNMLTTGSQQSKSGDSADAGSNNLLIIDEASEELTKRQRKRLRQR